MALPKSKQLASQVKTQELGAVIQDLNTARDEHAGLLQSAARDADYFRLANLQSRIESLTARETKLRREIAEALSAEHLADQHARWDKSGGLGNEVYATALSVDAAIAVLAEKLTDYRDGIGPFEVALPARAPDYESLQGIGVEFVMSSLKAQLQGDVVIPSLAAIVKDRVAVAMRIRPAAPEQSAVASMAAAVAE